MFTITLIACHLETVWKCRRSRSLIILVDQPKRWRLSKTHREQKLYCLYRRFRSTLSCSHLATTTNKKYKIVQVEFKFKVYLLWSWEVLKFKNSLNEQMIAVLEGNQDILQFSSILFNKKIIWNGGACAYTGCLFYLGIYEEVLNRIVKIGTKNPCVTRDMGESVCGWA